VAAFAPKETFTRTGFLLLALTASIAPVSQLVPLDLSGGVVVADRFLYVPSMLAVLLLADLVVAWLPARAAGGVALVLVLAFLPARLVNARRWTDTLSLWQWSQEMAPQSATSYLNLIGAYRGLGDLENAERVCRDLVALQPRAGYDSLLAEVLDAQGRTQEAVELLLVAPTPDPPNPEMSLRAAHLLLTEGHPQEAEQRYDHVLRVVMTPGWEHLARHVPDALAGGAEALARQGREPERARVRLLEAEKRIRADGVGNVSRVVRAWLMLRDGPSALRALALPGCVSSSGLLHLIGVASYELPEDEVLGRTLVQAAVRAGAEPLDAHWVRARSLGEVGRWRQSAAAFEEVLRLAPDDPDAHDQFGYGLFGAGDVVRSEREIRTALRLAPGHAWARYHLGLLLRKLGRDEEAADAFLLARRAAEAAGDAELVPMIEAAERER
jgi:tetratricopeptide (TPR) repeat protein